MTSKVTMCIYQTYIGFNIFYNAHLREKYKFIYYQILNTLFYRANKRERRSYSDNTREVRDVACSRMGIWWNCLLLICEISHNRITVLRSESTTYRPATISGEISNFVHSLHNIIFSLNICFYKWQQDKIVFVLQVPGIWVNILVSSK